MDDQFDQEHASPEHDSPAPSPEPSETGWADERTGDASVDGVLDSLDGLRDLPVDDHVAVFERAHEQLRSALDNPRED